LRCRSMDLFGAELVAIDGSKFKASNHTRRHDTQEQLRELLGKVEARIEEYLSELDRQDAEAGGVPAAPGSLSPGALAEKIARLRERKGRYDGLLGELGQSGENEISLSDADSRKMKGAHGEHFIGDNVQVAVDARHDLIVSEEVVQAAHDRGQLGALAVAAREELGVETLQAVADKGCHESDQLEACETAGVETFVPEPGGTSGRGPGGREVFSKEQFRYDAQADAYHCPGAQVLPRASVNQSHGKERILYDHREVCRECALKSQCTTGRWRVLARRVNEEVVERAAARVAARPELVAGRKEIVEHVFGTLRVWGHDHFLMRGLAKVRAEFSLSALIYNLRRVLNLRSVEPLLAVLRQRAAN
ncbi:MAG TPA: transposase, partial [Ktedonobacterales bacterium]|nr:transposase [Ktedonobacterales bacterium]